MRKNNRICLRVALVRAVLDPCGVFGGVGVKSSAIESEEVHLWRARRDPCGDFTTSAAPKHHAHGIEAARVVESAHFGLWAHERFVIGSERLGPTHSGLN